jgi:hypothetical protein
VAQAWRCCRVTGLEKGLSQCWSCDTSVVYCRRCGVTLCPRCRDNSKWCVPCYAKEQMLAESSDQ